MNCSDASSLLSGFRTQRVLVVGDVMLDRYLWGSVTRISPEAPVPIVATQRTSRAPGGAANVAATVAALGGCPVLVSAAGDEAAGQDLHTALLERGVSPTALVLSARRRTTVKTRIIAHNQQLLRIDEQDAEPIDADLCGELLARIEAALSFTSAIVLSDYAKGILTGELISGIMLLARKRGIPVLVDPKGSEYRRYSGASLLTPNRSEALLAAQLTDAREATVAHAGARLMDCLEIDALLITEGESGMTLFERPDSAIHLDASARVVYDVTGAGDAVIATLALALAAGGSLRTATYLANVAGGLAVEQVGTATISARAIEKVFLDTPHCLPSFSDLPVAWRIQ
jgi:D-beta-D-heptose 7-phosphate kinase/D-beta-D-heptose 1-phosphate adenosyltransferase